MRQGCSCIGGRGGQALRRPLCSAAVRCGTPGVDQYTVLTCRRKGLREALRRLWRDRGPERDGALKEPAATEDKQTEQACNGLSIIAKDLGETVSREIPRREG